MPIGIIHCIGKHVIGLPILEDKNLFIFLIIVIFLEMQEYIVNLWRVTSIFKKYDFTYHSKQNSKPILKLFK